MAANEPSEGQNADVEFQSERAVDLLGDFYPTLLENCMDDDEEVDTRTVLELLAGMTGLFVADYKDYYGHEKAMAALQEMVNLALNVYQQRVEDGEEA